MPALLAQGDESAMNLEGVCLSGHYFCSPQHARELGVNFRELRKGEVRLSPSPMVQEAPKGVRALVFV